MNRRDSLKAIGLTAISSALLLEACKPGKPEDAVVAAKDEVQPGREAFEVQRDKDLNSFKFFDAHEMATITLLADIIIPKDGKSGSASEAKVPEFIEFIVKDIPKHKIPMRGDLNGWIYNVPTGSRKVLSMLRIASGLKWWKISPTQTRLNQVCNRVYPSST